MNCKTKDSSDLGPTRVPTEQFMVAEGREIVDISTDESQDKYCPNFEGIVPIKHN